MNIPDLSNRPVKGTENNLQPEDRPFHNWYRFVLSFPPTLVRDYLARFNANSGTVVLDPFCGTGTTIVETKLMGVPGVGVEANPFPCFASRVKVDWDVSPDLLEEFAEEIAEKTYQALEIQGIDDKVSIIEPGMVLRTLPATMEKALIRDSISPLPLHKTLVLLDQLYERKETKQYQYGLLALGKALVSAIGNLRFGPEVGIGKKKEDVQVVGNWITEIRRMVRDIRSINGNNYPKAIIHQGDSRKIASVLPNESIDIVITSPPYPNEKDYTRTTRLESVLLGFYGDGTQLKEYKKELVRSNTRGVYTTDDDEKWVEHNKEVQQIAREIESRRIILGKTSGFEKLYSRVTRLYFGGMTRHLSELSKVLKPGAQLAYVVGDQASYLRIMIKTGSLLANIAQGLGYIIEDIELFRTRFSTATKNELREEVVILRWPGRKG